jgi:hypothetical protein
MVIGCFILIFGLIAVLALKPASTQSLGAGKGRSAHVTQSGALPAPTGQKVCGQPILKSPYTYSGASGPYKSGAAGLPTYGTKGSDFPEDNAGVVLPAGKHNYLSYQLASDTVYYLLPGVHVGGIQADTNDAFVGGKSGKNDTVLSGDYSAGGQAIDSNSTNGNQSGVIIEYLTIEKYQPDPDAAAVNQEANTDWTIRYNTITLNVPGAGIMAGSDNNLIDNCMTLNGQYGFQSSSPNGFSVDSLTGGPYNIVVSGNEISYNDTCDFSGLIDNVAAGWKNHNPVPASYRNHECGQVVGDGDQGGFKLWQTDGVTIEDNYIHDNWGPGGWADTDNANTTWVGNTFTGNEGPAVIEEISYNFSITDNYMGRNDLTDGLGNSSFPQPAIYISESGSDSKFGGVPPCPERECARQKSYRDASVINRNTLVDNGGNIFIFQNSNRYCSDGFDGVCTLVDGAASGPFRVSTCKANLRSAAVNTATYIGQKTGSPRQDWWDGCLWRAANVHVTGNTIDFNPADIPHCNQTAWPDCGAGGIFSEYGSPPNVEPGWVVPTELTFFEGDYWSGNLYNGPSSFYAWNQGNGDNPVSWSAWTGEVSIGDMCTSSGERQSGYCTGPFGQDVGSTYNYAPLPGGPHSAS